jgi:enamidase
MTAASLVPLLVKSGAIATGDVERPLADGDAIEIRDGSIEEIGPASAFDREAFDLMIDANGTLAAAGLIDLYVHPMRGDWHPRRSVLGWKRSALRGGVTSMLCQGTNLLPGRPRNACLTRSSPRW